MKATIIYGATFGPPFVFLHQMINRFKSETLIPFWHVGALPRLTEYVLMHRARPVKRRNMHWVREPTQTPSRGPSGLVLSSLTPRQGMSRDVFATSPLLLLLEIWSCSFPIAIF